MHRSVLLRIRPNREQALALEHILRTNCDLYNAALQERRDAWRMNGKSITFNAQSAQLTELHHEHDDVKALALDVARDPLRRVDAAFRAFFRRAKSGQKPGYPRFRARNRYSSFTFGGDGVSISTTHLRIPRLGLFKFKASQPIFGTPKTATVKRLGPKRWIVRVACDIGPAPEKRAVASAVGIDVGLTNFVTLSDGQQIDNPRWTRQHEERIANASRRLVTKKRGSKNRAKAREALRRAHQRAADARRNFTHHVSKQLVATFDLIAYEDLKIAQMVRGNLAKSILDAAWGELISQLVYKAEHAGKWAIPVNPRGTSQRCSGCGDVVQKTLAERWHDCPCGTSLDRDVNAARNVLRLGASHADVIARHELLS